MTTMSKVKAQRAITVAKQIIVLLENIDKNSISDLDLKESDNKLIEILSLLLKDKPSVTNIKVTETPVLEKGVVPERYLPFQPLNITKKVEPLNFSRFNLQDSIASMSLPLNAEEPTVFDAFQHSFLGDKQYDAFPMKLSRPFSHQPRSITEIISMELLYNKHIRSFEELDKYFKTFDGTVDEFNLNIKSFINLIIIKIQSYLNTEANSTISHIGILKYTYTNSLNLISAFDIKTYEQLKAFLVCIKEYPFVTSNIISKEITDDCQRVLALIVKTLEDAKEDVKLLCGYYNGLSKITNWYNITKVSELKSLSDADLLNIKGLGSKRIRDLRKVISDHEKFTNTPEFVEQLKL